MAHSYHHRPSTSSGSLPTITQDSDPSSGSSQVTGKTPNAKSNSVKIVLPIVLVILFIVSLLIFWRFRRRRHLPKLQPIQPFSEDRYTVFGVHDDTESQPDIIEHINSHAADSITTHRPYAVLSSSFNSGQITSDVKSDPSLDSDSSPIPPVPSTDGGLLPEAMARIAALEQAQRDAEMQILRLRAENEGWRHNQDSDQASLSTSPPSYYSPP
ncbi:hypothetical protein C8J56DRAFT_952479 [Mycena floridula]|nr:hypothetical protein C8J56DRAFT_952479 [Mycena floridula]